MLHAPISEAKTETAQSKLQLAPQPGRELHPHSFGATGTYALSGAGSTAPVRSPGVQRYQIFAGMQTTHGNQAVLRMMQSSPQVARIAALRPSQGMILQRKCACGGTPESTGECAECKEKHEAALQRRTMSQNVSPTTNTVPPIVHDVLRSPGQPLDAGTRAFMEPRFGYDFSQVRVHTDAKATESARAVNALAYTVGRNVVFGVGQYAPETSGGRRLVVHELTHVVQQSHGEAGSPQRISSPTDQYEQEADSVTRIVENTNDIRLKISDRGASGLAPLQRLVRTSAVTCPTLGGGSLNPFNADQRASSLLDNAITRINTAQAVRSFLPGHPDVVAVGNALHTVFHLDPASADTWTLGPPNVRLPVILRRLEIAKDYIDSVVFTVKCVAAGAADVIAPCAAGTCAPGTEAFSCHANTTGIDLCPLFWLRSLDQKGRVWAHEVFHINFGFIDDWGNPNVHNAHCYAQFVALLNGFNSPVGFRCP